jgi:hypothetical protein
MDKTIRLAPGWIGTDRAGCYTFLLEVFRALGIFVHLGNRYMGSRRRPAADLSGTAEGDASAG